MAETDPLLTLASALQVSCLARTLTVATAESCTGGLVAHLLTEIPGSSGYLLGGVVAYADAVKRDQLDVPEDMLAAHGAVSAQVALAMAQGVRNRLGTDLGIGITGVAGPDGGTPAKPVGLVYIAIVGGSEPPDVRRCVWSGDRTSNKRESARVALELLIERASGRGPG